MKYLALLCCLLPCCMFAQNKHKKTTPISSLAGYSKEWNETKYRNCNTAQKAAYLSRTEKDVIYILNLVRTYPALFARTVVNKYPAASARLYLINDVTYYQSLMDTLLVLKPKPLLYPDSICFVSARCHAAESGKAGTRGHTRRSPDCIKKEHYYAECCDYGNKEALKIVLSLLIDLNVPSLGHRKSCLGDYTLLGVSVQPHESFGTNAVLDFYY